MTSFYLHHLISKSAILRDEQRLREKLAAEDDLIQIIDDEVIDYILSINAIKHLCDLYLLELKSTENEIILTMLNDRINQFEMIAQKYNDTRLIIESLILRSKILLIQGNLIQSKDLIDKCEQMAILNNLEIAKKSVLGIKNQLNNQIEEWHNRTYESKKIRDRIELTKINQYLQEAIRVKELEEKLYSSTFVD